VPHAEPRQSRGDSYHENTSTGLEEELSGSLKSGVRITGGEGTLHLQRKHVRVAQGSGVEEYSIRGTLELIPGYQKMEGRGTIEGHQNKREDRQGAFLIRACTTIKFLLDGVRVKN